MIGIIVQLILSFLIVWFFVKGNLSVLGFRPTNNRLTGFLVGFIITSLFCASAFLIKRLAGGQHWQVNPALSWKLVAAGVWWNVKSVLFEELIFRGVLLYILIRKLGALRGIVLSAMAFGIYHWFSFGIIGNVTQMIIIFFVTGVMGLLLAYAYAKTFSLFFPIGIHLGWNLTQIFIFSQGPIGNGIFIPVQAAPLQYDSYLVFFSVTFLPLILAIVVNYLWLRSRQQVTIAT